MQVTINISEDAYRKFERLAKKNERQINEMLVEKLEKSLLSADELTEPTFDDWSDKEVLALANYKMPKAQADRMSKLLDLQQRGKISNTEKTELDIYLNSYEIATLRKAEGIIEGVKRGLLKSPDDLK